LISCGLFAAIEAQEINIPDILADEIGRVGGFGWQALPGDEQRELEDVERVWWFSRMSNRR